MLLSSGNWAFIAGSRKAMLKMAAEKLQRPLSEPEQIALRQVIEDFINDSEAMTKMVDKVDLAYYEHKQSTKL